MGFQQGQQERWQEQEGQQLTAAARPGPGSKPQPAAVFEIAASAANAQPALAPAAACPPAEWEQHAAAPRIAGSEQPALPQQAQPPPQVWPAVKAVLLTPAGAAFFLLAFWLGVGYGSQGYLFLYLQDLGECALCPPVLSRAAALQYALKSCSFAMHEG